MQRRRGYMNQSQALLRAQRPRHSGQTRAVQSHLSRPAWIRPGHFLSPKPLPSATRTLRGWIVSHCLLLTQVLIDRTNPDIGRGCDVACIGLSLCAKGYMHTTPLIIGQIKVHSLLHADALGDISVGWHFVSIQHTVQQGISSDLMQFKWLDFIFAHSLLDDPCNKQGQHYQLFSCLR